MGAESLLARSDSALEPHFFTFLLKLLCCVLMNDAILCVSLWANVRQSVSVCVLIRSIVKIQNFFLVKQQ